jgi:hypothetical protein
MGGALIRAKPSRRLHTARACKCQQGRKEKKDKVLVRKGVRAKVRVRGPAPKPASKSCRGRPLSPFR